MLLVSEVLPCILDGSALMDLTRFKRHLDLDQRLPKELVKRWLASIYEHATDHPYPREAGHLPSQTFLSSDATDLRF